MYICHPKTAKVDKTAIATNKPNMGGHGGYDGYDEGGLDDAMGGMTMQELRQRQVFAPLFSARHSDPDFQNAGKTPYTHQNEEELRSRARWQVQLSQARNGGGDPRAMMGNKNFTFNNTQVRGPVLLQLSTHMCKRSQRPERIHLTHALLTKAPHGMVEKVSHNFSLSWRLKGFLHLNQMGSIGRENQVLLNKLQSIAVKGSGAVDGAKPAAAPKKLSSHEINRRKQQQEIAHANQRIASRLQNAKSATFDVKKNREEQALQEKYMRNAAQYPVVARDAPRLKVTTTLPPTHPHTHTHLPVPARLRHCTPHVRAMLPGGVGAGATRVRVAPRGGRCSAASDVVARQVKAAAAGRPPWFKELPQAPRRAAAKPEWQD